MNQLVKAYHRLRDKLLSKIITQQDLRTFEFSPLGFPTNKIEMEPEQALKILGIEKQQLSLDLIQKRAVTIHDINDPKNEGSPYIQQKAINAYKTALVLLKVSNYEENKFEIVKKKINLGVDKLPNRDEAYEEYLSYRVQYDGPSDSSYEMDPDKMMDFIGFSSYHENKQTNQVIVSKELKYDVQNQDLILVEDMIDSGNTMFFAKQYFQEKQAKSLRLLSLIGSKSLREKLEIENYDYFYEKIPNTYYVGYGLDNNEFDRQLEDICALKNNNQIQLQLQIYE